MNLKEILAKIGRGEALTEAEKAFLATFDPQAALDAAAANARRTAEKKAADAEAAKLAAEEKARIAQEALDEKANEGKSESDKLKAENERLKVQIAERDKTIAALSSDKARMTREAKLESVFRKAGIAYLPKGVDAVAQAKLFKDGFSDLSAEDLEDETKIAPIVERYKSANEAILADLSGGGSGAPPKGEIRFAGGMVKNPWKKDSFNLTLQGQIGRSDPTLAEKLQKEAAA